MSDRWVTIDVGYVHTLTDGGECRPDCPHPDPTPPLARATGQADKETTMSEASEQGGGGDATVEYGIRRSDGRVEPVASRLFGERLVGNDQTRTLVRRIVTPWETVTPSEAAPR